MIRTALWILLFQLTMHALGCASKPVADPVATLQSPVATQGQRFRAIDQLAAADDPDSTRTLERVVTSGTYTFDVREAALNRLIERDEQAAKLLIRRTLPLSQAWAWVARLSEIIAARNWIDLTPALVSSWARPVLDIPDDLARAEHKALAKLHGPENVTDVVFSTMLQAKSVGEQGLRTRCWDLLHRLGERERLLALLASSEIAPDDAMLLDLRAGAIELGLVPRNREEILWLRKLREASGGGGERADFWSRAAAVVAELPPQRRLELELRDLPILVSASLHDPELLHMSIDELYRRVESYLRTQRRHLPESNYDNIADAHAQNLHDYRGELTWGDLAAMLIAIRAVQVPQVAAHLFDYAERDRLDTTTEYGGVVALDGKDRFEVREFPPRIRRHDNEFLAPQEMLDAAYTSIFHFHLHVQSFRNQKYAGPGYGDLNYADNLRANCLVLTYINKDTLNVDYYRHGRMVVDLGEVRKK